MLVYLRASLSDLWNPPRGNVAGLDGARTIAILLVIGNHFAGNWLEAGSPHISLVDWPVFNWGWTGVDLFFVLSGLLIGQQLWREYLSTGTVHVGRFLLKRTLRIWPLYFAVLLALAVLPLHFRPTWPDFTFLSNYYFLGGYVRGWSLSTEEQFYLLIPALFLLLGRRGARWVFGALALAILAVLAARGLTAQALFAEGLDAAAAKARMSYAFHLHSEALFLGVLLAYMVVRYRGAITSLRVLVAGGVACPCGLLLRQADGVIFNFLAVGLVYLTFVSWLFVDRSALSAPFRARIFYPLSRLAFGMYLNHFVI